MGTTDWQELALNVVGKARSAIWNGREYLVAPLTTIVPGVLAGSQGRLYYPPEQVARNHKDWDDVPITVRHPVDLNNNHVTAKAPDVLARQGIGFLRNSRIHEG